MSSTSSSSALLFHIASDNGPTALCIDTNVLQTVIGWLPAGGKLLPVFPRPTFNIICASVWAPQQQQMAHISYTISKNLPSISVMVVNDG